MKNLLSFFFFLWAMQAVGQAFITTWRTDNPGPSPSNQITIPTTGGGYGYSIYWEQVGNTAINGTISGPITGNHTITFPSAGTYQVSITGAFPRIYFTYSPDNNKILTVEQWGSIVWTSMAEAFRNCRNLTIPATDAPNLTNVTDMNAMFGGAISFNQPIDHWDVSNIKDMSGLFVGATNFNQSLNDWNVSGVTNMSYMFNLADNFNQPLGNWNVSNVTDMSVMFTYASSFNQPIQTWDVSKVEDMSNMFQSATSFNQPIETWNVSNVKSISRMFYFATSFNQPIGLWNVSSVTNMTSVFNNARSFNQPIGDWNVSEVRNMEQMFQGAIRFNQPIGSWDVGMVTNMSNMFVVSSFNQPIGNWNVSGVTDMTNMFNWSGLNTTNYDQTLIGWAAQNVKPNLLLGAEDLKYCDGEAARAQLITSKNWIIYGDSKNCAEPVISITQPTCAVATGTIAVSVEDASDTYSFDNGITFQASNLKSNLTVGVYQVIIKHNGLNSPPTQAIINAQPPTPSSPMTSVDQPTCMLPTGTIIVTVQNPSDTYSFDNGNTFQVGNGKSGLVMGTYKVIIKNSAGCRSQATQTVINAQPLIPTAPIISLTQPTCQGTTGTITITIQNADDTYSFDNGTTFQVGNVRSGLNAGTYSVIIKNIKGCNSMAVPAVVNSPLGPPALPQGMDSICYNFRTGVPYQTSNTIGSVYTWFTNGGIVSEGQTTPQVKIDWLDVGEHKLWVKDENATGTDYCESFSDTLKVTVFKDLSAITMNFVSVDYDGTKVQIRWDATLLERISDLIIVSRRIAGSNTWEVVATLKKNIQSFLDQNVPTNQNIYEYKVEGFNKCDEGLQTVIHNTIKLEGEKVEEEELIDLSWNDYNGWEGVERYEIWRKLDGDASYKLIDVTPGDITDYIGKHGADGFVHVLRIKAKKQNENTISWSNEIELDFENPIDFIPNVITPNGDTKNEYFFIPKLELYPENHLSIYNRWGEGVFVRSNYENNWNASGLPEGIYYYTLYIKKNNRTMKGWVQVVR